MICWIVEEVDWLSDSNSLELGPFPKTSPQRLKQRWLQKTLKLGANDTIHLQIDEKTDRQRWMTSSKEKMPTSQTYAPAAVKASHLSLFQLSGATFEPSGIYQYINKLGTERLINYQARNWETHQALETE